MLELSVSVVFQNLLNILEFYQKSSIQGSLIWFGLLIFSAEVITQNLLEITQDL